VMVKLDWIKEMENLRANDETYAGPVDASTFDGA